MLPLRQTLPRSMRSRDIQPSSGLWMARWQWTTQAHVKRESLDDDATSMPHSSCVQCHAAVCVVSSHLRAVACACVDAKGNIQHIQTCVHSECRVYYWVRSAPFDEYTVHLDRIKWGHHAPECKKHHAQCNATLTGTARPTSTTPTHLRDGIVQWVKKKTGPPATTVEDKDTVKAAEEAAEVLVLGYFKDFKVRAAVQCSGSC